VIYPLKKTGGLSNGKGRAKKNKLRRGPKDLGKRDTKVGELNAKRAGPFNVVGGKKGGGKKKKEKELVVGGDSTVQQTAPLVVGKMAKGRRARSPTNWNGRTIHHLRKEEWEDSLKKKTCLENRAQIELSLEKRSKDTKEKKLERGSSEGFRERMNLNVSGERKKKAKKVGVLKSTLKKEKTKKKKRSAPKKKKKGHRPKSSLGLKGDCASKGWEAIKTPAGHVKGAPPWGKGADNVPWRDRRWKKSDCKKKFHHKDVETAR